jgi:excisionase family DNA binding protein
VFSRIAFGGDAVPASCKPGDVDIATAAAQLNTSTKFIRRRIADGTLPAYRLKGSRLIRIRREDLEALKQPVGGAA